MVARKSGNGPIKLNGDEKSTIVSRFFPACLHFSLPSVCHRSPSMENARKNCLILSFDSPKCLVDVLDLKIGYAWKVCAAARCQMFGCTVILTFLLLKF